MSFVADKYDKRSLEYRLILLERGRQHEKYRKLFKKLLIAFKDIHDHYNLKTALKYITIVMNKKDHYITCDMDEAFLNNRKALLYKQFKTMPDEVKELFNNKFPDLLRSIKPHIKTTYIIDNNIVDDYWTCDEDSI